MALTPLKTVLPACRNSRSNHGGDCFYCDRGAWFPDIFLDWVSAIAAQLCSQQAGRSSGHSIPALYGHSFSDRFHGSADSLFLRVVLDCIFCGLRRSTQGQTNGGHVFCEERKALMLKKLVLVRCGFQWFV